MTFQDRSLRAIYDEIRQRREDTGRLSLIEFDDAEYGALLKWARRIVRRGSSDRKARTVFLAFACAFVRRTKYTADNIFWDEFEDALRLRSMERRPFITYDLLWPAYADEDIDRQRANYNRRIVGSLVDEIQNSRIWLAQARSQFIPFFKWYYQHAPDGEVSVETLAAYQNETDTRLPVPETVLPVLSRDCQALALVIDYAIEHDLYLWAKHFDDYRAQIIEALGPDYDPAHLRLIHDERSLVKLIRELQNHCTPSQFKRTLDEQREGSVKAPWGEQCNLHTVLRRWSPFPYGVYQVNGEDYHVVPHRRLRLETLETWPFKETVHWRGQYLGYKKASPFQVTIGRRVVDAVRYVRSRRHQSYIWLGEVPVGQKLTIDGHLRPESTGSDWETALHLSPSGIDRFELQFAITRLMLYYPERAYYSIQVRASTSFEYEDALRADGVRRFHLHPRLIIPLEAFDQSVEIAVSIDEETVLHERVDPERHYLFSVATRERVRARGVADYGDQEYVLFTRSEAAPHCCEGVNARRLPEPYGEYSVYQIIWENPDQPFDLRIETAHWAFLRRREFITILEPDRSYDHFRLKPRQCFHFQDLSLRLYSTLDLTVSPPTMEVCGIEGVFGQVELKPYLNSMPSPHFYDIEPSIWDRVEELVAGHHGRYVLRFYEDNNLLDKAMLSRIPPLHLAEWDEAEPYPEKEPLALKVTSTDCPIWNSETERPSDHAILKLHPKTQAEPWSDHSTLRRITSEPISGLVSFPDLSETVEVVVRPRLFGFRLYLKRKERMDDGRFRSRYQPIRQVDYYHLNETALHVFSAPHTRIDIAAGALNVISEESDKQGDWLFDSLACLRPACLDEENEITIRSAGLRDRFSVRRAPLLYDLAVEDEAIALHFDGPEGTAVRLWLRDTSGMVIWTKDVPCESWETTTRVPLPSERPATGYVTAGYVLTDGSIRPATSQAQIKKEVSLQLPSSWLSEGIGVTNLSDLQTAAFQERKT